MVDAFLAMFPDRVLNRQVRDFIRNGKISSGSQPDSGELSHRACASGFGSFSHSLSEVR